MPKVEHGKKKEKCKKKKAILIYEKELIFIEYMLQARYNCFKVTKLDFIKYTLIYFTDLKKSIIIFKRTFILIYS